MHHFYNQSRELFDSFLAKLEEITSQEMGKAEEFVIYPILLLLSRLNPSFYLIDDTQDEESQSNLIKGIHRYAASIQKCSNCSSLYV